jgi:hypothetical protein
MNKADLSKVLTNLIGLILFIFVQALVIFSLFRLYNTYAGFVTTALKEELLSLTDILIILGLLIIMLVLGFVFIILVCSSFTSAEVELFNNVKKILLKVRRKNK